MARRRNKATANPQVDPKLLETGFGMEWRIVTSGRAAVAQPNEAFWAAWREKAIVKYRWGFRVEKLAHGWEVSCDLPNRFELPAGWKQKPSTPQPAETMPDHRETGLFSPGAANNLRAESDGQEFERIHGYEEDDEGYGDIRGYAPPSR